MYYIIEIIKIQNLYHYELLNSIIYYTIYYYIYYIYIPTKYFIYI